MQAVNAVIGGEGSNGGIIFPPVQLCRDTYTGMAFLLDRMAATGQRVSELAATLPRYHRRFGKMPFEHGRLGALMQALENAFPGRERGACRRAEDLACGPLGPRSCVQYGADPAAGGGVALGRGDGGDVRARDGAGRRGLKCYNSTVPAFADNLECSREEALRRAGISERQLRSWEQCGLVRPTARYGIDQLIALRTLAKLRAARVPTKKIRRAVEAVRKRVRGMKDPFTDFRIYSDGQRVRVQVGGVRMESESGQLLLDFDNSELTRLIALPSREHEEHAAAVRKKQREAEVWFQKGVDLEHAGAPVEEAVHAYGNAVSLDPAMAAAMVNLGTIHFAARSWEKAEEYYRQALEASPKYALAHFNIGNLFDERGDRASALSHYLTAIEMEPEYGDAHYNLALLYQTSGQVMKAVRHWRTYLKIDPVGPWAEIARRELDKLYATTVVAGDRRKLKQ